MLHVLLSNKYALTGHQVNVLGNHTHTTVATH